MFYFKELVMKFFVTLTALIVITLSCNAYTDFALDKYFKEFQTSLDRKAVETINLSGGFTEESTAIVDAAIHTLVTTKAAQVVIIVDGPGGDVALGNELIEAIHFAQKQGKIVYGVVPRYAASMDANILCHMDNIKFEEKSIVLFHAVFYYDKNNRRVRDRHTDAETASSLQPCLDKGIITKSEFDAIIKRHVEVIKFTINGVVKTVIQRDEG